MTIGRVDIDEGQHLFGNEMVTGIRMNPEHLALRSSFYREIAARPQGRKRLVTEHREQCLQFFIGLYRLSVFTLDRQVVIRQFIGGFSLENPGDNGYGTTQVFLGIQYVFTLLP
ncbi:hypothetical protein D3C76_1578920 [compost metagenome]